ncbi:hypothetical protein IPZ58_24550 [Streptomyces roseoverticillatus]|uniref:hypothetical protein n=1 Tax=Streptomyces roseoverticillatus TaxID=66429 RepID=UPI001F1669F5|nr:hypothetical protein [Streptomyces roseoverticillatus]MCF3104737.1 hypothetical protein [Streptomyces roseoverticillatus]
MPVLLGREEVLATAWREILDGRPVEFHGPCGFGKTSLLRNIASGGRRSAFVRVGRSPLEDVLQLLVDALYVSTGPEPVKYSAPVCRQLVRHSRALIVLDEVPPGSRIPRQLADALPGCVLLVGGEQPVLGGGAATSRPLTGLSQDAAFDLFVRSLGRTVRDAELPVVRRLLEAVRGRPLSVRQAAALVRAGHPVEAVAERAARGVHELDRMSAGRLSGQERKALAVLAIVAGTLVPGNWVAAAGDIAYAAQTLLSLHERGLVERPEDDRFGLPVCLQDSVRDLLLDAVSLSAAVNGLADWLDNALDGEAHGLSGALEGAEGVVGLLGFAAERAEWRAVIRLAKIAEAALFAGRRWQQWKDVLEQGEDAARRIGDQASEALFTHQLGTVAYAEDRPEEAASRLRHALQLRVTLGDTAGAELTRENLAYVEASGPDRGGGPGPARPNLLRRGLLWLAALAAVVVVVAAVRAAVAGAGGGDPSPGPQQRSSGPVVGGSPSSGGPSDGASGPLVSFSPGPGRGSEGPGPVTGGSSRPGGVTSSQPGPGPGISPSRSIVVIPGTSRSPGSSSCCSKSPSAGVSKSPGVSRSPGVSTSPSRSKGPVIRRDPGLSSSGSGRDGDGERGDGDRSDGTSREPHVAPPRSMALLSGRSMPLPSGPPPAPQPPPRGLPPR